MAAKLSTEPYKGVRDFYPEDWARMGAMFSTVRETLAKAGYEEYQASPLERAELYEAKTSEEIVSEQTYTFMDRGDRRVTLRPEMTPSLARMVAHKRRELPFPLKWFSIGNRFRYERPQKGRLREFYQMDIDLVGAPEGEADLEIMGLVQDVMRAFGAPSGSYVIRMNSRPLLNAACLAAGIKGAEVKDYLHLLDRKNKISVADFARRLGKLGTADPLDLIANAGSAPEVAAEKKKVLDRIETLRARGVESVVFDPTVSRGFDYYTGMVFEVFDTDPGNARSLFGGGRYDGLVALFSGDPIPAVGFAIGDVTLADFIETHGLPLRASAARPQMYLGTPSAGDIPAAQAFAKELRKNGSRVFVNITEKSLGDQVKDALKRHIDFFVAYGKDETASGTVRMKQLSTGVETGMPAADLPRHLPKDH